MPLLHFLRKTNTAGAIQRHLQRKHAAAGTAETLEAFANAAPMDGEVLVGAKYLSRYNDRYYGQWLLMHVPFRSLTDLWDPQMERVPERLRFFALCLRFAPEHWSSPSLVRKDLELEGFNDSHVQTLQAMHAANAELIAKYLAGELDPADDDGGIGNQEQTAGGLSLDHEQTSVYKKIMVQAQWSVEALQQRDAVWQAYLREEAGGGDWDYVPGTDHAFALRGPAGSGKSTVVEHVIWKMRELGARILIACPTGKLSSSYRQRWEGVTIDTVHGAFCLYKAEAEATDVMRAFDLIIVDEIGQLSMKTFERLMRLWRAADKLPTLVLLGDFCQLPGFEVERPFHSPLWRSAELHLLHLRQMRRCKCAKLKWKLELLRQFQPTKTQLRAILKGHRSPPVGYYEDPSHKIITEFVVRGVYENGPKDTLFLTITRSAAALLNAHALEYFFGRIAPQKIVPADPEAHLNNYVGSKMTGTAPSRLPLYVGLRVVLTRNRDKANDFVNGMGATVTHIAKKGIYVRTDSGRRLCVYPMTDDNRVTYYPLRLGYATTLHKVQGATLRHITIWLDIPNVPGAAYVALSRVSLDQQWRFIGGLSVHHFKPVLDW